MHNSCLCSSGYHLVSRCWGRVWLVFSSLPCVGNHDGGYRRSYTVNYSNVLYYTAPICPFDSHLHCIVVHYRVGLHASRHRRVGITAILEQPGRE
jgi:hypothetical protein